MRPLALLALALLAPGAVAADLLPTEAVLGEGEARFVVRSASGEVVVRTEPPVLAAAAGEEVFDLTPRTLRSTGLWRGMEGVVEVVLRRDDPTTPVDVILEDGSTTGVWVEWPARPAQTPGAGLASVLAAVAVVATWRAARLRA